MYNKDIVELCNRSQKVSGLTLKKLKLISELLDTKSKAKTREGLCEAIIKKVYTNRLDGKPDFYNENWGFDKYSCKNVEKNQIPSPPTTKAPPIPPPVPPPLTKKVDSKKKSESTGPSWNDVMSELKNKANAKKQKYE